MASTYRLSVILAILLSSVGVYANGYRILGVKSTKASSMGEAVVVGADDPSSVAFNPAALPRLDGNQVGVHVALCNAYSKRTDSATGATTRNNDKWQAVPSFFFTSDMGTEDMGVGLGISLPNGLSSEWADDSFARYVATYSSLLVTDISPAIGWRATDWLMVGGALDYFYSEATLKRMIYTPMGDVESRLSGSGSAWSFNVGAICDIGDRSSVGLSYHHSYTVDYDGSLMIADLGYQGDVTTTIDFPGVVAVGYAFAVSDKLKVEANVDWTLWQSVGDVFVDVAVPVPALGIDDSTQVQGLRNTITYKIGAEYSYSDTLSLRAGYIRNENATPEANWRPSLADTDAQFITCGFGYTVGDLTVDTALQLVLHEDKEIDNNVDMNETLSPSTVDGMYEAYGVVASVSGTYRF